MAYFEGSLIRLRAMEPEDLDVLYSVENDPDTWNISNFTVPYSRYALRQYLKDSQSDIFADRQMRLMIVRRGDEKVVGTIDLFDYQPMHARGEVGIAVMAEHQRCGYATEALRLFCDYLFSFLHMKQLTAHVSADNQPSLNLFASCGFHKCGLLREWWRSGEGYADVLLLQCLRGCAPTEKT